MHVGSGVRGFRPVVVAAVVLLAASCATPDGPGDGPDSAASPGDEPTSPPETSESPDPVSAGLTITLDETGEGPGRTFTLLCDPTGGDHPDPAAACAALTAAGGAQAMAPPSPDEVCTEIYGGPAVATVQGTVDGLSVSASFGRSNGCEIRRWDVLAPLLGSAGGGL